MSRPVSNSMKRRGARRPVWQATLDKTLHRNPYFGVLQQSVKLPNGSATTYYTLDFQKPAVGVVAMHRGRFLLLRQYRFIVDEFVWAIPSGGVHAGESPKQAAARELREETGYRATRLRRLHAFYASYGCSNQVFDIFLASGLTLTRDQFDRNEVISLRWFSARELLALIARNGVVDGLSLAPLLLLLVRSGVTSAAITPRRLNPPVAPHAPHRAGNSRARR